METILDLLKEVLKGVVRELSAHVYRRKVLEKEKTTRGRRKQKGGSHRR
ncbi:hypothetical protein [Bacillus sp. ISL-55]|nr:hypothetical protein [Bacillus sp. ISL-55]MBT2694495.1 hypothetical protein [Bacillus sp. ISL-55]